MPTETKIHADIEALREHVPETQDLYREVCTILFFRYGITPTANKLYQYVRKGSMSAPAEALAKFWEDLREKSRVRIEHPDLPDTLKSAAGELVAALWSQAQSAAQDSLEHLRSEVHSAVLKAQTAKDLADSERAASLLERDQALHTSKTATDRVLQLERDLASESAGKMALVSQLETVVRQQTAHEAALVEARRDFATELEKHRQALKYSEERFEASETRALLEIDRERTESAKLQKELAQGRQHQQHAEERHRKEFAQLQGELGGALQKAGMLEGMLQELRTRCLQQSDELQFLRTRVVEAEARKGLAEQDLTACRELVVRLEEKLQQNPKANAPDNEATIPRKRTRKTNT
ncbi:MAG: DNA-binding protein [Rhodocyclaceae bacterium]|nr:DNA-binding protein [Rhodocyclaceae bacterium]